MVYFKMTLNPDTVPNGTEDYTSESIKILKEKLDCEKVEKFSFRRISRAVFRKKFSLKRPRKTWNRQRGLIDKCLFQPYGRTPILKRLSESF